MLGDSLSPSNGPLGHSSLDALSQLEQSTDEHFEHLREHERFQANARARILAGSSSHRTDNGHDGACNDISEGGCRILASRPVLVGDIYYIVFERHILDIPPVFARCLRCRFLREDMFEMGFTFLTPIDLPGAMDEDEEDSLL